MKIKSLILSSVAVVGFSTAAMAADLGTVLTSLDVCDALGISGLTISSDTDCLQITGNVSYEFKWGDYNESQNVVGNGVALDALNFAQNDGTATIADNGNDGHVDHNLDWNSNSAAWLKFVATADSSFGPAKATIKFSYSDENGVVNEGLVPADVTTGSTAVSLSEAWVSVGDSTVLMAGRKGSIANLGNDEPYNFLGLFNSSSVGTGVGYSVTTTTGGHVIQLVSDLGNGLSVKAGLENLNGGTTAGTAVGVLEYAGDGIAAHVTVLSTNVLSGAVANWAIHSGISAEIDNFKIRGALAADSTGFWNVLGTAEAAFDMFTLAGSAEATSGNEIGFGVSAGAQVTTGVKINAGFKWFDTDTTAANTESYDAAVQLVAAVTDTLTLTGTVGVTGNNYTVLPVTNAAYFGGELAWAPGGGFTSSLGAKANALGAYSVTFKAAKDFM